MNKKVMLLVHAAVIAALYVVLTMIASSLGLSNYPIQLRFSEALTILPFFTPAAVPGLFVGCLLANLLTPNVHILDIVFGSLATLLGAMGTYCLCGRAKPANQISPVKKWLAPLPPIISNILIIPWVLAYAYKFEGGIPYFMLTVGIGEILSCGVLGLILLNVLQKYRKYIFRSDE